MPVQNLVGHVSEAGVSRICKEYVWIISLHNQEVRINHLKN